jgi:hypothetical protein
MAEEIEWFVGIDWASQSHQVCLVDANGSAWGNEPLHGGKNQRIVVIPRTSPL